MNADEDKSLSRQEDLMQRLKDEQDSFSIKSGLKAAL
jgi:hypothetical protein